MTNRPGGSNLVSQRIFVAALSVLVMAGAAVPFVLASDDNIALPTPRPTTTPRVTPPPTPTPTPRPTPSPTAAPTPAATARPPDRPPPAPPTQPPDQPPPATEYEKLVADIPPDSSACTPLDDGADYQGEIAEAKCRLPRGTTAYYQRYQSVGQAHQAWAGQGPDTDIHEGGLGTSEWGCNEADPNDPEFYYEGNYSFSNGEYAGKLRCYYDVPDRVYRIQWTVDRYRYMAQAANSNRHTLFADWLEG